MKKIFLNQKLINFFEKIREEIFNNGFSRYIIDTIAPTLRFFSFILKNINKIYFFLIKKLNLKKIFPYTVIDRTNHFYRFCSGDVQIHS